MHHQHTSSASSAKVHQSHVVRASQSACTRAFCGRCSAVHVGSATNRAIYAVPRKLNEDFGSSAGSSTHPGKLIDAKIRVQKYEDSRCGLGCF